MQKELIMKYPASWQGDMWREGAPCGNGKIGALVYGGVLKENILINHAFLWKGGKNSPLPDISESLPKIRKLLDENNSLEADGILSNALNDKGYDGEISSPLPLCDIRIDTPVNDLIDNYSRKIDMEKAVVTVSYKESGVSFSRSTFVSRKNDNIVIRYTCDKPNALQTSVFLDLHDTETLPENEIPDYISYSEGNMLYFASYNESAFISGDYGAVCRVITDGTSVNTSNGINIKNATEVILVAKVFVGKDRSTAFDEIGEQLREPFSYVRELEENIGLHNALFNKVDFSLSKKNEDHSNEELLLDSFTSGANEELIEKLYAYGRYLFICSTSSQNTLPCHLLGLWNGSYKSFWGFYMYNVNFQMIYWQALSGNLPEFLKLALDYTESFMEDFRENAKKLFGCRGILINSVNTPESALVKCKANHILNWTGGAAWISQHFWDYYNYTEDITYLREHALPFMAEAALFYEDFAVEGDDGILNFYPCVSPENTPENILELTDHKREIETTKNATMEIALVRELLTNLIKGNEITGMYSDKVPVWKGMLKKLPPYRINEDGAIAEWIDGFYKDNYYHRHHSHLYPVFPAREVVKGDELYPYFEKAEELRLQYGLSSQSSWSVVYMAFIAARMEKGDRAFKMLDAICRNCLMNNFFTLHNDWRRMGPVACDDMRLAPFQIDANIGIPAAINEMLAQSFEDKIFILPALPQKWEKGKISGLLLNGNITCDITWNKQRADVILRNFGISKMREIKLGSGFEFDDKTTTKKITDFTTVKFKLIKNGK